MEGFHGADDHLNDVTAQPSGFMPDIACLIAPSLPYGRLLKK